MNEPKAIENFLMSANISLVAKKTGISRPTLYMMKRGDFSSVQYRCMKAVSDMMDNIFEGRSHEE